MEQTDVVGVSEELRDPLGYAVAAAAGGATWLLLGGGVAAAAAGAAVGGVVFGTKIVAGALGEIRNRYPTNAAHARQELPAPPPGSEGYYWIRRAEVALVSLRSLADNPPPGGLTDEISQVDDQAEDVVTSMRQVAGRLTVLDRVAAGVDPGWLVSEQARLDAALASTDDDMVRADLQGASRAVSEQLDSYRRLGKVREALVARLQSTTIGLEGLVTKLAEVITIAPEVGGGDAASRVLHVLTRDLDGMRMGLTEVAAISRGELGGGELGGGELGGPVPGGPVR